MSDVISIATESMLNTISAYGMMPTVTKGSQFQGPVAHVQIDFYGDKKALFILEMSKEQACSMVSSMMTCMGMPMDIKEFDTMAKSALGEMCNQISGGICTAISNTGLILDIKPPQVDERAEGLNPMRSIGFDFGSENKLINAYFLLLE